MSVAKGRSRVSRSTLTLALLGFAAIAAAQKQPPHATVTTLLEKDGVTPGGTAYAAVRVVLPEKLHCNSHTPRDKGLIPFVLTITPTEGVAVQEIVYPQSSDLKQAGSAQPLSVYEGEFLIGVRLN